MTTGANVRIWSLLVIAGLTQGGCFATWEVTRQQKVLISTEPPGATVWEMEGDTRKELGPSPQSITRPYRVRLEARSQLTWFWVAALVAVPTFFTIQALRGEYQKEEQQGGPVILGGISLFYAAWAAADMIFFNQPKEVSSQFESELLVGASLEGFIDATAQRAVPGSEINLALQEKWWRRYGILDDGALTTAGAVAALARALGDPKAQVRLGAASALETIGPPARSAIGNLILLLADENADLRGQAVRTLLAINAPEPRVLAALQIAAKGDFDPSVRDAAEIGLHKLELLASSMESPKKTAPAEAGPRPARIIIAVFEIRVLSWQLSEGIRTQLQELLSTALTQTGRYAVIPRDQLQARLREEKKEGYKPCYDEQCQIELGKAAAAQKILSTTIQRVGKRCLVTANLFDLKTETAEDGKILETNCSQQELMDALRTLAVQLASPATGRQHKETHP